MRSAFAAVAFLAWINSSALGQAVGDRRFDPTTGDYFVLVMDDDLQLVELRVVPPNKVLASIAVMVTPGDLRPFRYVYTVDVRQGTQQPLKFVEIDCPASTVVDRITATAVQNGVPNSWNADQIRSSIRPRCEVDYKGEPLAAGGTLETGLETVLLPTIGELRLFGGTPGVSWPTFDPIDENEPARAVINELSGFKGGWKSLPAPVPGRDPATVTTPLSGVSILQNDLDRSCGSLAWITSAGVCSNLRTRLQQAGQAVINGDNNGARTQLQSFLTELEAQHNAAGTLPVNDSAFWLLKVNAEYVLSLIPAATATTFFLNGSGGTANPPTLSLSSTAPTGTTAKYKDSPAIQFSGGNPWVQVGTWSAAPALASGTLSALGTAQVWLGLKNSDDIGTNYDLRTEVYWNGTLVASGQTLCIQGITRNPDLAKQVSASFGAVTPASFNGSTDVLSLKVLTRLGTTASGASCGGHSSAVGLRLYFDAANRAAKFDGTF